MSYFKNFPSIYYDLNRDEKYKLATDVLRRVTFNQSSKNEDSIYIKYDIKEGETPEEVAHKLYDNHTLYWVVLLFNDIINKNKQWPMNSSTMDKYISRKYPGNAYYIFFDSSSLDEEFIKKSTGSCFSGTSDVYRTGIHTINKGYIATNEDGSKIATIYEYDPSYSKFIIEEMTEGTDFLENETIYIKDGELVKAICYSWKKSKYSQTVNRFIDDNKNKLNQMGSYNDPIQRGEEIQTTAKISNDVAGGACSSLVVHEILPFEETVLGAYKGDGENVKWVTNYEAEQEINDKKRSINLLRPEVIIDVVTQFEELISQ
jgi:hypothetical protein